MQPPYYLPEYGGFADWPEIRHNLTERFQVSLDWKDRSISMGGNQINQQDMYTGSKKVMNELFLLKRSGNNFGSNSARE